MKPLLLLALLASCAAVPQEPVRVSSDTRYGFELQAYPAGVVGALRLEQPIGDDEAVSYRVGWNETDRRDWGEHDDESGGGAGLGFGYTRWLDTSDAGWFWGGQLDLWALDIDWRDDSPAASGATDVIVVQPTLVGGYTVASQGDWRLDWTASLGAEINVDTDGEDVGEGAILLIGLRLTNR